MKWSQEAEARIQKSPFFIREIVRKKAEEIATSKGKYIVKVQDIEIAKKGRDLQDLSKVDLKIREVK